MLNELGESDSERTHIFSPPCCPFSSQHKMCGHHVVRELTIAWLVTSLCRALRFNWIQSWRFRDQLRYECLYITCLCCVIMSVRAHPSPSSRASCFDPDLLCAACRGLSTCSPCNTCREHLHCYARRRCCFLYLGTPNSRAISTRQRLARRERHGRTPARTFSAE